MPRPSNNQEHFDEVYKELHPRVAWEQKMARVSAQRHLQDRPRRALTPWVGASNIRFPLSATLIRQKKPVYFQVVYNSQNIAYFRALRPENLGFAGKVATLYNDIVKLYTDFEEEIQYATDAALQDGECIFKITWDHEQQVPVYTHIENLAFITPAATNRIDDAPWVCEVLGLYEHQLLEKFSDVPGIQEFIDRVKAKSETNSINDTGGKDKDAYAREGISQSAKGAFITLWEKHYLAEDGSRRIRTISPDEPEFDFQDDHEYEYEFPIKRKKWMYEHTKLEFKSKHMHSAQGIPEMVQEFEHTLSAIWRLKQNIMALFTSPILFHPSAQPPGSTQNFTCFPGAVAPYPLEKLEFGPPPLSLDQEMNQTRSIVEQYVGRLDFGIGDANTQTDSRTKYEVQQIANVQSLVVNLDVGNWKRYIAKVLEQGWHLCAQFKPKVMEIVLGTEVEKIPEEALNGDYFISITTSAESLNKETEFQKALALYQTMGQNPFSNLKELTKNVYEKADPMQVDRFVTDPQQMQAKATDKALGDIAIMMTTLEPIQAKPNEDFMTQAITAVRFLQKMFKNGVSLTQPQVQLIAGYIASNREALKQTNKEQYLNLSEILNQLDQAANTLTSPTPMTPGVPEAPPAGQQPSIPSTQPAAELTQVPA